MTDTYDIAVIEGDGIGPEILGHVTPWLTELAADYGVEFRCTSFPWGSDYHLETGAMMPEAGVEQLRAFDAILLGAVGHPDVPDHVTLHGLLLPIRKQFDQRICLRPSVLYDGVESPLRGYRGGDIDFVVYRENTEGEYANVGGRVHTGFDHEVAIQTGVFTRSGTESIVRAAFEAATEREHHLTSVTKSNAQAYGMVFWDEVVSAVATDYPAVTVDRILVDAAAMDLIRRPEAFDVIVASNLFGDILTDIGAIITGSMGLAPSANLTDQPDVPSMFEPVHGSAPDIAGQGIANPLATILSAAMLCESLGEEALAAAIEQAVTAQLADQAAPRTPDLGGDATTREVVADLDRRMRMSDSR